MESLDAFLRVEMDVLQYAAFFGALMLLSAVELVADRSQRAPQRIRRWPPNFGLTMFNIMILGAIPVSGVLAADYARDNGIGLLNNFPVAPALVLVLGFLLRSFVSWMTHLAMHKVPLLWRVHRVHHTDTFLDVSTTVRFHPIEFLISTPILIAVIVASGISPVVLMLYEVFDAAMAVFTHSNIRLPRSVDRALRLVLVTPDMHRVHHSSSQPETDSNYGATLSIWDYLFRTYRDKSPEELGTMQLGLTECQDDRALSFRWLLMLPFRALNIQNTQDLVPPSSRLAVNKGERQ